jgi:MFS family permease
MNAAIAHLSALLTDHSIAASGAVLALSMLGVSGIVGRLITGYLLDRLFAPYVSLGVLLISGVGIVTIAFGTTTAGGILGAFLMGFGAGSEADVVPYLIAKYFGRARFSTLYGLSWTAYAIGGATGPVVMGHAFDKVGGYQPVTVLLFAVPLLLGAGMQMLFPRYPATAVDAIEGSSLLEVAMESAS